MSQKFTLTLLVTAGRLLAQRKGRSFVGALTRMARDSPEKISTATFISDFATPLTYQTVVDWVIGEHKSQGLFQTGCQQDRFESFWIFGVSNDAAVAEMARLIAAILKRPESTDRSGIAERPR